LADNDAGSYSSHILIIKKKVIFLEMNKGLYKKHNLGVYLF